MTKSDKPHAEAVTHLVLYTKEQAAAYLQVTPRYINRQVALGKLRAFKPSAKIFRVRRSDLDSFIESGSTIAA